MQTNAIELSRNVALDDLKTMIAIVQQVRSELFTEGTDYGPIPGTNDKPVLLLPGMEKLMRALHLRAEYDLLSSLEDFDTPRFFYRYCCRLVNYDSGITVATANGSANSMESKWRWRDAKRICPKCGKDTINKSKKDDGWYCWAKIGGCGAQFGAADKSITDQQIGRVENPDLYDQLNTIDKIAQKRALGSAIKLAANVSAFFTVDLEDLLRDSGRREDIVEGQYTVVTPPPESPAAAQNGASTPPQPTDGHSGTRPVSESDKARLSKGGQQRVRDWQQIFKAVEVYYPEDTEEARKGHWWNGTVKKLEKAGKFDGSSTDHQVVNAIIAYKTGEGGWWNDEKNKRDLTANLFKDFVLSVEDAVGAVGAVESYPTMRAFLTAVAAHVAAQDKQPAGAF